MKIKTTIGENGFITIEATPGSEITIEIKQPVPQPEVYDAPFMKEPSEVSTPYAQIDNSHAEMAATTCYVRPKKKEKDPIMHIQGFKDESELFDAISLYKKGFTHEQLATIYDVPMNQVQLITAGVERDSEPIKVALPANKLAIHQKNIQHDKGLYLRSEVVQAILNNNTKVGSEIIRIGNDIREKYLRGDAQLKLAKEYNMSQTSVSKIVRCQKWVDDTPMSANLSDIDKNNLYKLFLKGLPIIRLARSFNTTYQDAYFVVSERRIKPNNKSKGSNKLLITNEGKEELYQAFKQGETIQSLADRFGLNYSYTQKIISLKRRAEEQANEK